MKLWKLILLLSVISLSGCKHAAQIDSTLRQQIADETALFRQGHVPPDSTLCALVADARNAGDRQALCHALYLQGSVYNYTTRYDAVMTPLKEAETLIRFLDEDDPTAGMIYIVQGSALEQNDYLWTEAGEKYAASVPYFERSADTLRLACAYRDMARMSLWKADTILYEKYFRQALDLAQRQSNRLIYHDIYMQYLLNRSPKDTELLLVESKILCDSFALYRYAWIPAEYCLDCGATDSARYWIDVFAADTIYTRWSAEKYQELQSRLLSRESQWEQAYQTMYTLYHNTMQRIHVEGTVRTYAIARLYDLEREQQKSLRLTIEKQRLWLLVGVVALFLLISLLLFLIERSRRLVREHEAQLARQTAQQTAAILDDKRASLKKILQQRVGLAVRLRRSADGLPKGLPAWVQNYLEENTFSNDNNWQAFLKEFNAVYGSFLDELHKRYKGLTEQDDRFIALAMLGLDNNEIAVLLNVSDRTIWNRRQKLRTRLGNPHLDLNHWLATQSK